MEPGPFECGCQLVRVEKGIYAGYDVGYVDKWKMNSCPLHEAAEDLREAMRQIVLPLRELLEEDVPDYVATIEITTTVLRLGLNAYDRAAKP